MATTMVATELSTKALEERNKGEANEANKVATGKVSPTRISVDNDSFVSHEVRAGTIVIDGNNNANEVLEEGMLATLNKMTNSPEKERMLNLLADMMKNTQSIKSSIESCSKYTNGELSIAKIKAGKLALTEFDPQQVIEKIINNSRLEARKNGITINFAPLANRFTILSDENRLYHVLNNLIINAIKFTHKKFESQGASTETNGRIFVQIKCSVESDSTLLDFSVKDNGIGMEDADKAKLFECFSEVHPQPNQANGSPKYSGSGLGLYISKIIVEQLGGDLSLSQTKAGEGSTFSFSIRCTGKPKPVSAPNAAIVFSNAGLKVTYDAATKNNTHNQPKPVPKNNKTILIVDDNSINQSIINRALSGAGYTCLVAKNGIEVLKILEEAKQKIDLILMDKEMPEMDGVATSTEIRKRESLAKDKLHIPIIGISATQLTESHRASMLACGMDDCIDKATKPSELIAKVNSYCIKPNNLHMNENGSNVVDMGRKGGLLSCSIQ